MLSLMFSDDNEQLFETSDIDWLTFGCCWFYCCGRCHGFTGGLRGLQSVSITARSGRGPPSRIWFIIDRRFLLVRVGRRDGKSASGSESKTFSKDFFVFFLFFVLNNNHSQKMREQHRDVRINVLFSCFLFGIQGGQWGVQWIVGTCSLTLKFTTFHVYYCWFGFLRLLDRTLMISVMIQAIQSNCTV